MEAAGPVRYILVPVGGAGGHTAESLSGHLATDVVQRGVGPEAVYAAEGAQSYLALKEERDMLEVKCQKLSSSVDFMQDPLPRGKAAQFLQNQNKLFEAEIRDLQGQLAESETFKHEIMQSVKEMKAKLSSLSTELLEAAYDPDIELPLP